MHREAPPRVPSLRARSAAASSRLDESHLGAKVSLLFRIEGDPEHPFSEVVGLLQRIDTDPGGARRLAVLRRNGELVEVLESDVIRWKLVPTR
jgi:hypothetical protein